MIRKPPPCPFKNDMVSTLQSSPGSMDATEPTGTQVAEKEVSTSAYGDWMVIVRKKKTHCNSRNSLKGYVRKDQGRQLVASKTREQKEIP